MSENVAQQQEMVLPDEAKSVRDVGLWAWVLALLVLVTFGPGMQNGFIWDDPRHVTENKALQSAEGLYKIWFEPSRGTAETYVTPQYYPLTHTSYWIEYHLWGLNPTGYHVTNIVLHAISVLLVWGILRELGVAGAWVAAAIFAVHPVQVETVAWITERKNTLCGVFYFAAVWAYLKREGTGHRGQGTGKKGVWYGVSLLLFVCALLSKTIACSMPGVVLLLIWWKRGRIGLVDIARVVPFFVIGAVAGANTAWMERHVVRAVGGDWEMTPAQHAIVAGKVVWFYVGKLLWPWPLMFMYPRWEADPGEALNWIWPIGVVGVFVALWELRRRIGRGPVVAWGIYVVSLAPAMGFVHVYPMRFSYVADHFQYLAGVPVIVLIVGAVGAVLSCGEVRESFAMGTMPSPRPSPGVPGEGEKTGDPGFARDPFFRRVVPTGVGVVIAVLAVMSWRYTRVFANPETLWTDVVRKNDSAWLAHANLGAEWLDQSQRDSAEGMGEEAKKKLEEAKEQYARAIELYPNYGPTQEGMGMVMMRMGKPEDALGYFQKAGKLAPEGESVPYLLDEAGALEAMKRLTEAQQVYVRALGINSKSSRAYFLLGRLLEQEGNLDGAQMYYEQAVRFKPDFADAHYRLALALMRQKKNEQAMGELAAVVELRPDWAAAHQDLAALLAQAGHVDEAAMHYNAALRLQPNNADAEAALGYLAIEKKKYPQAREFFEMALKMDPNNAKAKRGLASFRVSSTTQSASATRASTIPGSTMPAR